MNSIPYCKGLIAIVLPVMLVLAPLPASVYANDAVQGCALFKDPEALQARADYWAQRIEAMPGEEVLQWVTGQRRPPPEVTREARNRLRCLLDALGARAEQSGSGIHLPNGARIFSSWRRYQRQADIWRRKYEFRGLPFHRITRDARSICGALVDDGEERWSPAHTAHRTCWLGSGEGERGKPTQGLSPEQRQVEILQATAAPGLSRHHWGTDFDLLDSHMDPLNWQPGAPLHGAYRWMDEHAASWGFFQPYSKSYRAAGGAHIEERWHWSYYPVARALLTVAGQRSDSLEKRLLELWGSSPELSLVRGQWRRLVFSGQSALGPVSAEPVL